MKYLFLCIIMLALCWQPSTATAQIAPTDNPYFSFYGPKAGHWTDSLPWGNIFNINNYTGATMVERYNAARDAASAAGGGVVYFPAGTYQFEDNIQLVSNVIIRGTTPTDYVAMDSTFAPPTRFEFPQYIPSFVAPGTPNSTAFKYITAVANSQNTGIVYVDINRAGITMRYQNTMQVQTRAGLKTWNADNNRNYIVFGVRSNNVASPDGNIPTATMAGWERFSSRFAANIGMSSKGNMIVANCRINDRWRNAVHPISDDSYVQPGYMWDSGGAPTPASPGKVWFRYTDHHGISVGRKSASPFAEPDIEPDLFTPGNEIRDNWVYKTMRVGIYAAGQNLVIDGNVIRDSTNKRVYVHPTGTRYNTNNAATYENRGIDWSGWHVTVTNNAAQVTRHRMKDTPYSSVDGEGILIQECCGGTSINGALIRHNDMTDGGYIGIYKMRDVFNVTIDSNNLGNQRIWVDANTNGQVYALVSTNVDDNYNVNSIIMRGDVGGAGAFVRRNQGTGAISASCHVVMQNNIGLTEPPCVAVQPGVFPEVVLASPTTDLDFQSVTASVDFDAFVTAGTPDSLFYYVNTELVHATTAANPFYTWPLPQANGLYQVAVKARDAAGREGWSNHRNINYCVNCIATSTQQLQGNGKLAAFPNPTNGDLNFTLPSNSIPYHITVTDLTGKTVHRSIIMPGGQPTVYMQKLSPGTYLVEARGTDGRHMARVVKQ